jgi:hypothetical protein
MRLFPEKTILITILIILAYIIFYLYQYIFRLANYKYGKYICEISFWWIISLIFLILIIP